MNILGWCNHEIIQLQTEEDYLSFEKAFADEMAYTVPASFLKKGTTWAVWRRDKRGKGAWVSGYALVDKYPLRSLQEIPEDKMLPEWNFKHIGEFTAFWISKKYKDTKYFAFFFTAHMIWKTFIHPSKYYIYSYPISEEKLGDYYAKGHPLRIYSGPINRLEGHAENPEPEHIELLTTWGIWKIFFYRCWKYFRTGFKGLF